MSSSERFRVPPPPPPPREQYAVGPPRHRGIERDIEPLYRRGSWVEVIVDYPPSVMRWVGQVERAASGEHPSFTLIPYGVSNAIEFQLEEVRQCYTAAPFRADCQIHVSTARLQSLRRGTR